MKIDAIFIFILISMMVLTGILVVKYINNENAYAIYNKNELVEEKEFIQTNVEEEKITPNTTLMLKKTYKKCTHTINDITTIPGEMVNLTKEEIIKKYPEWDIEKFSKEELILSKEMDGTCGEHYMLTEEDGYICIYMLEDDEKNKKLKEKTELSIEYLTETDKITLKNGIRVYGGESLKKVLEDFEG